jgi:exonuclease SbcC
MLTRLKIKNFQPHEVLEVELDPLVTVFVGATDKGKSSVLRSLRWLSLNDPQGEAFIRWGSVSALARLEVDGRVVIRKRGGGVNLYSLDGDKFKSFGTKVPDPIAELLNVDEVNFAGQLDAPFWFLLSPPQVSRELNAIVNLSAIDSALSNVAAAVRQAKSEVEIVEAHLREAKAESKRLESVPMLSELLNNAQIAHESHARIGARIYDLL